MQGGDKTTCHHGVRDRLYKHGQAGGVRPLLEAAGLLERVGLGLQGQPGTTDDGRRPADVLLCQAQDVRTGSRGNSGDAKVALDVAVVCPQTGGNMGTAAMEILGAAEEYCRTKCGHKETEEKCRERGIVFQPMIFESTGGVAYEAVEVIKCLNRAVAEHTNSPYGEVAQRFWQRISIDIQRAQHRALARRTTGLLGGGFGDGLDWAVDWVSGLKEPGQV